MLRTRIALIASAAFTVMALAGCTSGPSPSAPPASEAPAGDDTAQAGGSFGCTEAMLAYLAENGYADVPPADPSTFAFPDGVDIAATPTCYVFEELGADSGRGSAMFFDEPDAAFTQATEAFAAAGWQGEASESLAGPLGVWWSDGADVTAARYSVGGGVLDVDGSTAAWFTWGY